MFDLFFTQRKVGTQKFIVTIFDDFKIRRFFSATIFLDLSFSPGFSEREIEHIMLEQTEANEVPFFPSPGSVVSVG